MKIPPPKNGITSGNKFEGNKSIICLEYVGIKYHKFHSNRQYNIFIYLVTEMQINFCIAQHNPQNRPH